jgi:L-fucose mutarotase
MLKTRLLHPEVLAALASNGHGSRVLIADGNYPFSTGVGPAARKVFLNFAPGKLSVIDVLEVLVESIVVEGVLLMSPADGPPPEVHRQYRAILGDEVVVETRDRFAFYDEARSADTGLVIATADTRRFANVLLTMGVVR